MLNIPPSMTEAEIGANVKDVMTRDVVTVRENDTLQDLLKLFKNAVTLKKRSKL